MKTLYLPHLITVVGLGSLAATRESAAPEKVNRDFCTSSCSAFFEPWLAGVTGGGRPSCSAVPNGLRNSVGITETKGKILQAKMSGSISRVQTSPGGVVFQASTYLRRDLNSPARRALLILETCTARGRGSHRGIHKRRKKSSGAIIWPWGITYGSSLGSP